MKPQWASAPPPPKNRDTGPSDHVRLLVKIRAGSRCESCGSVAANQIHHRRPRGMGGTSDARLNRPSNLVYLCSNCHRTVESQRDAAREAGFLVPNGMDPAARQLLLHDGRFVLLTDDGSYSEMGRAA